AAPLEENEVAADASVEEIAESEPEPIEETVEDVQEEIPEVKQPEPIQKIMPEQISEPIHEQISEKSKPVPVKRSSSVRVKKPENPSTVEEHAAYMRQTGRARVLSEDAVVVGDYSLNEMFDILPKLKSDAYGVLIDTAVDQKFIDTAFKKGLKYVVAKDFEGIVRRPVGIRLITL
ncbi:MAG: DNA primase, partial [Methanocorpusculum sp.]|nr:DNA primase [Methanocorpusculum sp.]